MNPFLPPPTGRMKFVSVALPCLGCLRPATHSPANTRRPQSLNPFYMFNEILGPALCRKFACVCCCLVFCVIMVVGAPFLNILFSFPEPIPHFIIVCVLLCTCGIPAW